MKCERCNGKGHYMIYNGDDVEHEVCQVCNGEGEL